MFWKRVKCLLFGHDEKLIINELEVNPHGGFTIMKSKNVCYRCKRRIF